MKSRGVRALFLSLIALVSCAASALDLITAVEARLADDAKVIEARGITRAPTIQVVSPAPEGGTITSPFELGVSFVPHGGARIDPSSVKATYLKLPRVDLSQRLHPYTSAAGIQVSDAKAPPGEHRIQITVRDSDGRTGILVLTLRIAK